MTALMGRFANSVDTAPHQEHLPQQEPVQQPRQSFYHNYFINGRNNLSYGGVRYGAKIITNQQRSAPEAY